MKGFTRFHKHIGIGKNWRFYSSVTSPINNNRHYDIIISGGGMVGFAMACRLGNHM